MIVSIASALLPGDASSPSSAALAATRGSGGSPSRRHLAGRESTEVYMKRLRTSSRAVRMAATRAGSAATWRRVRSRSGRSRSATRTENDE
eukprot:1047561-Prorocentrum_minimum.AAC.1